MLRRVAEQMRILKNKLFTKFARKAGLDDPTLCEAIANAAEFAYVDAPQRGTMDVSAAYDVDSDTLAVRVNDRGRWRHNISESATAERPFRGRGIPLMRALADYATIDRTPQGTHVTLTWTRLTLPGSAT